MYAIEVTTEFAAAHTISIAGRPEPIHGHNWHVTLIIAGETLDSDGLLCDFHTVHAVLEDIVAPFHNNNLSCSFGGAPSTLRDASVLPNVCALL